MARDTELSAIQKTCKLLDGMNILVADRVLAFVLARHREKLMEYQAKMERESKDAPASE